MQALLSRFCFLTLNFSFCLWISTSAAWTEEENLLEGEIGGYQGPQVMAQRNISLAMKNASALIEDYCQKSGGCPQTSSELEPIIMKLKEKLPPNPLSLGGKIPLTIAVIYDEPLNEIILETYKKTPPNNWKAPAGTITMVISTSNNIYALWASGLNERPIRSFQSQKVLMLTGHCTK